MKTIGSVLALTVVALLPLGASAQTTYEPQRRLRTPLDTCIAGEVMQEAYCVRKCQSGFKMDTSGGRAKCVATRADAKYIPPAEEYKPPPYNSNAPKVPGA